MDNNHIYFDYLPRMSNYKFMEKMEETIWINLLSIDIRKDSPFPSQACAIY